MSSTKRTSSIEKQNESKLQNYGRFTVKRVIMDSKNRNWIEEPNYVQNMFIHLFRKLLSKCCGVFTDNDNKFQD